MLKAEKQEEVHLFPKVSRTLEPRWRPMEMLCKYHGWHARRRCVYICVGKRYDPQGLRGLPENYINYGRFSPRQNEAERQIGFSEKTYYFPYMCVHLSHLWLSHSIHLYISVNKRKRKRSRLYFNKFASLSFSAIQHRFNEFETHSHKSAHGQLKVDLTLLHCWQNSSMPWKGCECLSSPL